MAFTVAGKRPKRVQKQRRGTFDWAGMKQRAQAGGFSGLRAYDYGGGDDSFRRQRF